MHNHILSDGLASNSALILRVASQLDDMCQAITALAMREGKTVLEIYAINFNCECLFFPPSFPFQWHQFFMHPKKPFIHGYLLRKTPK